MIQNLQQVFLHLRIDAIQLGHIWIGLGTLIGTKTTVFDIIVIYRAAKVISVSIIFDFRPWDIKSVRIWQRYWAASEGNLDCHFTCRQV